VEKFFSRKRFFQLAVLIVVLVIAGLAIRSQPTAREVVWQGFANLFGFFTTPFILEATVAVLGLIAVMTYNQWRISKEGDGWVYLPEPGADDKPADPAVVPKSTEAE
jgi:hypothetical protein